MYKWNKTLYLGHEGERKIHISRSWKESRVEAKKKKGGKGPPVISERRLFLQWAWSRYCGGIQEQHKDPLQTQPRGIALERVGPASEEFKCHFYCALSDN